MRRKMERPKSHREQATMLAGLMEEAADLPPIPLSSAAQCRWALEFEGETLMTYRRGAEDRWDTSTRSSADGCLLKQCQLRSAQA